MKLMCIIPLLLLCLLFSRCSEKQHIKINEIKTGSYDNMMVNTFDTVLSGAYYTAHNIDLDPDNNGIYDIRFNSCIWGSPAVGNHPKSSVMSLNENTELYVFSTNDTLFLNRDTTIYDEGTDNIAIAYSNIKTYSRINQKDSVISITPGFKIQALQGTASVNINNNFLADTFTLFNDAYQLPPSITEKGDTTFYRTLYFYNNQSTFPLNQECYIAFRLKDVAQLGWIKLCLANKNKLVLIESAIQE